MSRITTTPTTATTAPHNYNDRYNCTTQLQRPLQLHHTTTTTATTAPHNYNDRYNCTTQLQRPLQLHHTTTTTPTAAPHNSNNPYSCTTQPFIETSPHKPSKTTPKPSKGQEAHESGQTSECHGEEQSVAAERCIGSEDAQVLFDSSQGGLHQRGLVQSQGQVDATHQTGHLPTHSSRLFPLPLPLLASLLCRLLGRLQYHPPAAGVQLRLSSPGPLTQQREVLTPPATPLFLSTPPQVIPHFQLLIFYYSSSIYYLINLFLRFIFFVLYFNTLH